MRGKNAVDLHRATGPQAADGRKFVRKPFNINKTIGHSGQFERTGMKTLQGIMGMIALLAITGCASNISTPSGRPEVSYEAPPEAVAAALTSEMIRRGYLLTDETPRVLTFQKAGGLGTEVMWGDGATVEARFNLIDQDGLTRVLADAVMIDGRNRRLKLDGRNHTEMQAMLEELEVAR